MDTNHRDTTTPLSSFRQAWEREAKLRRDNPSVLAVDLAVALLSLVFARYHLFFGAYPLGVVLPALLTKRVPIALAGAVLGALSLGTEGIIYALSAVLTVLIRVVVSGSDKNGQMQLFMERMSLRASAALIGGFVGAVYTLLLRGLSLQAVAYALTQTLVPGLVSFLLYGVQDRGIGPGELLYMPGLLQRLGEEKGAYLYFQVSFLAFSFLTTLALSPYGLFGVSLAYVFAGMLASLVAKRFGAIRGMAVGFVSMLGISPIHAVGFALAGGGAGLFFSFGDLPALILGGVAIGAWGGLSLGLQGFLSLFPEYAISALLILPLCRKLTCCREAPREAASGRIAADMVGTMALTLGSSGETMGQLAVALSSLGPLFSSLAGADGVLDPAYAEEAVRRAVADCCKDCDKSGGCVADETVLHRITDKLISGKELTAADLGPGVAFCHAGERLLRTLRALPVEVRMGAGTVRALGDCYGYAAKLAAEAKSRRAKELEVDEQLSERAKKAFAESGFYDGVARVYGTERPVVLAAGTDREGSLSTAPGLKGRMEEALGLRLSEPELFHREQTVLLKYSAVARFGVESATAYRTGAGESVSGDTVRCFEGDGHFFALLSDGMGSGAAAKATSEFAVEMLRRLLCAGTSVGNAMTMLNHALCARREESSATVDLFVMDLLTGEAGFCKSGAASSYIKRGDSVFRIRSATAPLGLLPTVDAERIRVEVAPGDMIILLSDGVSAGVESIPHLVSLLGQKPPASLTAYAERILTMTNKKPRKGAASVVPMDDDDDDATVTVLKITAQG